MYRFSYKKVRMQFEYISHWKSYPKNVSRLASTISIFKFSLWENVFFAAEMILQWAKQTEYIFYAHCMKLLTRCKCCICNCNRADNRIHLLISRVRRYFVYLSKMFFLLELVESCFKSSPEWLQHKCNQSKDIYTTICDHTNSTKIVQLTQFSVPQKKQANRLAVFPNFQEHLLSSSLEKKKCWIKC